jgi:hypothetical protein
MNDVILCVGCSWTYGHGLKNQDTYPAILQDKLKTYKVINAGHCGSDLNYAIFSAVRLIKEFNPRYVIFQITSFDRITLGTDGFENFLSNSHFSKSDDIYYEDDNKYLRLLGIGDNVKTKFTHGSFIADDEYKLIDFKDSKIKSSFKEYKFFVKILFENLIYSDYYYNQNWLNLFLFQKYLESSNIQGLFFQYLHEQKIDKFPKIKSMINESTFIKLSFRKWLDIHYPKDNFFIDNGYHLSRKGNEILVNEYLMPYLEKLL